MKPTAYEGSKPYIFASYAHKDHEAVYRVLVELEKRGYRVWYDDGIAPGSEWPEDIARHLNAAAVVFAFITPAAMQSTNCRREINFSLSREKPFLSIMLEPTEMSLGMEMQLSAQQMIVRQNFTEWDRFIEKILSYQGIGPCRELPPAQKPPAAAPGQAPAVETAPENPQSAGAPTQQATRASDASRAASQPGANTPAPTTRGGAPSPLDPQAQGNRGVTWAAPGEVHPGNVDLAPETQGSKPRRKGLIAGIVAAAAALALIAALIVGSGVATPTFETSWGTEVKLDATSVSISGQKITQEDLEQIASLENLGSLSFASCDLSACDFSAVSFASPDITSVDLSGSTGIGDYGFLSSMPLHFLHLSGCSDFSDLSLLDMQDLRTLDVDGTGVSDLAPLQDAHSLDELSAANTQVESLEPLAGLTELSELDASGTAVASLEPLLGLENIHVLDLAGCPLSDTSGPLAALSLARADLSDTGISSLSLLADCTVLEELDVSGNAQIDDLSQLDAQNKATLKALGLANTGLDADDLAWLQGCAGLVDLNLDGLALQDLDACEGLAELERISAVGCGISDIEGLSGCPNLKTVQLGGNAITSVAPLAGIAQTNVSDTVFDLSYNALESVAELPAGEYRALLLAGNAQGIASTIPDGMGGYEVVVPWYEGIEESALADGDGFSEVYLLDCPQNNVLRVTDALGEHRTNLVDETELLELLRGDALDYALNIDSSALVTHVEGERN